MLKAILFDFDGVLAKSNGLYARAFLALFKRYKIQLKRKALLAHFGEDHQSLFRHFVPKERFHALHRAYHKRVLTPAFYRSIHLLPGTRPLLRRLRRHYSLGLCTGSPRKTLRYLNNHLRLKHYFGRLSCADDVQRSKPHPDLLLYTLRKLRAKPSEALYIGDAPSDVIAAKRARIRFVAVLTGVLTKQQAKRVGVKYVLSSVLHLPRFLEKLN